MKKPLTGQTLTAQGRLFFMYYPSVSVREYLAAGNPPGLKIDLQGFN
jgi:hypothetical protein